MPNHTNPKIILKNLRKAFGNKPVLNGVDLSIEPGESLVVIGGSGSGKSVMLKCILGIVEADKGSVRIDGVETLHITGKKREAMLDRFGMLFQGSALFDSIPVWRNVAFKLMQARGVKGDEAKAIAIKKLAQVGLGKEVADLFPAELSGGMQKRVSLARAIAADPQIIFFDEPTTGLDPIMADVINDLILQCVHDLGATAISITHDMASAHKIADRVAMLYQGQIIWHGSKAELDHSGNAYVDQFIHGRAEGPIKMQVLKG